MIKEISFWERVLWTIRRWRGFKLPSGQRLDCWKDRRRVDSTILKFNSKINWATNTQVSNPLDPGKVSSDGVGSGTPMQGGLSATRVVTWGSGYGRYNQWRTEIPLSLEGMYWVTGYPTPQYDKRCIVVGPDNAVHELIQFDQDAPIRPAGLPQQALNRGRWVDGVLVDGVATTASDLPSHGYIWGVGSIEDPHVQAMTIQDYLRGDGSDEFKALSLEQKDLPVCGDWYYLSPESSSYKNMVAKGGQCEARAKALVKFGVRLIDRAGNTSFLTQAGSWADKTNIREFQININDLRRVEY